MRQFFGASCVAAVAGKFDGIGSILAILATVFAVFCRIAVAGGVSAFLVLGHNLRPPLLRV
jgi:hypothetical protein